MHGRIYEIAYEPEDCAIAEEMDFDDGEFIGKIADYVSAIDPGFVPEELEQFADQYSGILEVEESGLNDSNGNPVYKITIINKEAFFEPRLQRFLENAEKFAAMVSKDKDEVFKMFMGEVDENDMLLSDTLEQLQLSFSDDFGDYVYTDGIGPRTFNDFLREAENGAEFYISSLFDYHS